MDVLRTTRRSLHGVGELLLAGPQHRQSGTIRLRVLPDGFATVADPPVRVSADALHVAGGSYGFASYTYAQLGAESGLDAGAPEGLYHDGSGVGADDDIQIDAGVARTLLAALWTGDQALRLLAPDEVPVLWPEHFDVGITLDEVNYGVSLGDATVDEPYAYVGPHKAQTGEFWNVSFGAARPLSTLVDADAVAVFFTEGRRLVF